MIKTIGLSKIFRTENVQTTALNEVNIEINRGEFVAIMRQVHLIEYTGIAGQSDIGRTLVPRAGGVPLLGEQSYRLT